MVFLVGLLMGSQHYHIADLVSHKIKGTNRDIEKNYSVESQKDIILKEKKRMNFHVVAKNELYRTR